MSKADCDAIRPIKYQYVIIYPDRFGRGDMVEFFPDRLKADRRREQLRRSGISHTTHQEAFVPESFLASDGAWYPAMRPSGQRELVADYIHPKRTPSVPEISVPWKRDDGGREAAGYKGRAGDCVTRSIAIATGKPYAEVYDALFAMTREHAATRRDRVTRTIRRKGGSPRNGVNKAFYRPYLEALGWRWVPTMKIGSGAKVHLRPDELPGGTIIARVAPATSPP